ncbi:MAG: cation diffusion facilitator family transporter [Candidatus Parcubacteria bacterium]|nr:cation diffusion facilitator family transporter [Candidatus Parcubacteria bacterium]
MNEQEQTSNKKKNVAMSSVFAGFVLTTGKFAVGLMTGSMGILSEAAHSLLDMGAAIITYFAVRVSDKPADEDHHYGHGKIEAISALIETALLFITSFWIIYEAGKRLMTGNIEVEATWYAFAIVIISIIIDYSRSRALMKVAKETGSQALEADALHFSTDIWSSAVVLVGLICVLFDIKGADSVAALFVAIIVMKVGYDMGKRTFDVLIDAAPEGIAEKTKDILTQIPGIIEVESVRARAMGPSSAIDALIVVGRKMNAEALHELTEKAKKAIQSELPEAEVIIHTKSIQLSTETIVETVHLLGHKYDFPLHHVTVETLKGKRYINCDLEVLHTLTVRQAHEKATEFETLIQKNLGEEIEVNTHIDPSNDQSLESRDADISEKDKIIREISEEMRLLPKLRDAHNILIRRTREKLIITIHCHADPFLSIEEAHDSASDLERLLMEKKEYHIERVVVHVEPIE